MKKLTLTSLFVTALSALAAAQATQVGGTLTVVTPNADDDFTVQLGPKAGQVQIFGATGIDEGFIYLGVENLVVRTNGGYDKVRIIGEAERFPIIDLNTGTGVGESEINLKYMVSPSAVSTIRVTGDAFLDKSVIYVDSDAFDFRANWSVNLGNGLNEGTMFLLSNNPTARAELRTNLQGGASTDLWNIGTETKAGQHVLGLAGNLGGGEDDLVVNGKGDGNGFTRAFLASNLDMGLGNDKAQITMTDVATTQTSGQVLMGEGNDILEAAFTRTLQGSGVFNAGGGDDTFIIKSDLVLGNIRVLMGAGNDYTEFLSVLGLNATPLSDGGIGFDIFKGVGRRINYEQII